MKDVRYQENLVYEYIEAWINYIDNITEQLISGITIKNEGQVPCRLSSVTQRLEDSFSNVKEAEIHMSKLTDKVTKAYIDLKHNLAFGSFQAIEFSTNKVRLTPMIYSDERGKIKVYRYTDDASMSKFFMRILKKVDLTGVNAIAFTSLEDN